MRRRSLIRCWLLVVLAVACDRGPLGGGRGSAEDKQVVARIDGQPITLADLQRRMAQQAPFVQARYSSPERRKELLDNLVRFEILAREAQAPRLRAGSRGACATSSSGWWTAWWPRSWTRS